jgi:3-phosphoshikimate 1-carboxyvinyltransferase
VSLNGAFRPPGDKSISHRLALFSALAEGRAEIENFSRCADVQSSLAALRLLGASAESNGDLLVVHGAGGRVARRARIDCGNSGTTMRLLMGILVGRSGEFILDGDDSLRRRPMERVAAALRLMGAQVGCPDGKCPVRIVGGDLRAIEYELPAASAQLKSAVILAGLQAEGVTTVNEPVPSRDHTERLLSLMAGNIARTASGWRVQPSRLTLPERLRTPGDASSAAFFLAAAAIVPGSDVIAEGVLLNPTRIGFVHVLRRMGALVEIQERGDTPEPWGLARVRWSPDLSACSVSPHEVPSIIDEVPILALVATQARGGTVFEGVGELRVKESDRLAAISSQLARLGAKIEAEGDALVVHGPTPLRSAAKLSSFGDHRIAMTLRLASLLTDGSPAIEGEESVDISYPGFHATLRALLK